MLRHITRLTALLALLAGARAHAADPEALIYGQRGTLPIILTAPHGGSKDVPGSEPRSNKLARRFVVLQDLRTKPLALGIAAELERLLKAKPYVVGLDAHRKYLDANRRADDAYESDASKAVYEAFHGRTRTYVDEVRAKFGRGLLLDVHGQAKHPEQLLRGTMNARTIKSLLARHGDAAVVGPTGLFGLFQKHGLNVAPENKSPLLPEVEGYIGGYITDAYGSQRENGIDAFQLEFGSNLRAAETVDDTAKRAAKAIAEFYLAYLKPEAQKARKK